ncbi:MAG: T9SS type A sorting domain-containing protein, partial [Candidatus Kapabacteria bacterium]|nr:T9SS type A sorting domain-containing protein [Candidatus Kapabacteria bacterium]
HNAGNVPGNKDVSKWTGEALSPGPIITNYDFGNVRVGTLHKGTVYVGNTGDGNLVCNDVLLVPNGDSIYTLDINNIRPRVNPNSTPPETVTLLPKKDSALSAVVDLVVKREFNLPGTVEARFNGGQAPVQGTLKGFGFLEKIAAVGAEFITPVEIRSPLTTVRSTPGQDTQYVRIWNTSTSAPLKIHSVTIDPSVDADNPHPTEFTLVNPPQGITIPIGAARNDIAVTFTPVDDNPRDRRARVIIAHNASPAEPIFKDTAYTTVYLIGHSYQTGDPTVTGKDFGIHLTCDSSINSITITNPILAGTPNSDINIIEAEVIGVDRGAFSLVDIPTLANPLVVPAGTTVPLRLQYFPSATRVQNAAVVVRYSDPRFAPDTAFILGTGETVNVKYFIDPPLRTPQFGISEFEQLSIKTDPAFNWTKANITQYTATITYKHENLNYIGKNPADVKGSGLDNTWNIVSATTSVDNNKNQVLTIIARGTTPLTANAEIAKFPLQFLAAIVQEPYQVKLDVISQDSINGNDRICVNDAAEPGVIIPQGCYAPGRQINVSGTQFALMKVTPQPTTGNTANISYAVGFEADTKVQIINMLGEVVATPVDKRHTTGEYSVSVPLNELGTGKYIVRLVSGPFVFVEDLVVTK